MFFSFSSVSSRHIFLFLIGYAADKPREKEKQGKTEKKSEVDDDATQSFSQALAEVVTPPASDEWSDLDADDLRIHVRHMQAELKHLKDVRFVEQNRMEDLQKQLKKGQLTQAALEKRLNKLKAEHDSLQVKHVELVKTCRSYSEKARDLMKPFESL